MLRTCFLAAIATVLFLFSAANSFAQDEGSGLIFTGCPPYVEGNHCDSMFYQVVAVDVTTGKACPLVRYFIVSGPGEINQWTGLWVFHPEREELPPHYREEVEIAAYKEADTTTAEENCRFDVRVYDQKPVFEGYCGAHITVLPFDTAIVSLEVTDADWCHEPELTSVVIQPEPSGSFEFDTATWTVAFMPDSADRDTTFEVLVGVVSGPTSSGCRFYFDVFEPEPIKLRIASVEQTDIRPGDTVGIDLIVEACPAYLELVDLSMRFDSRLLDFAGAIPGAPFFDPDSGCGWVNFNCGRTYGCLGATRSMLYLYAFAGGGVLPSTTNCYRPRELPAVLATLQFVVTDRVETGREFASVDFYWCDCKDNCLWSPTHEELYMASIVMTPEGQRIKPIMMPGPSGASDECFLYDFNYIERVRRVWFRNGGADITPAPQPAPYSVRIPVLGNPDSTGVPPGSFVEVPVILESIDESQGFGGFDLLTGYDASALSFQLAFEGVLYDSCGWEYFTYRYGGYPDCGTACPSGMLRVVGLAETNNGPAHPGCDDPFPGYVRPDLLPVTLANLRFLVSNNQALECQFVPLRFFWYDCGDNAVANHDGNEVYLSAGVFDYHGGEITGDGAQLFPTFQGAPDECLQLGPTEIKRKVDYHGGGMWIICADTLCLRGDITVNGVPYEIADGVMFTNYFIMGLAAFGSLGDCSIAASDVNADGIPLTIADLIFLMRVIVGQADPNDPPQPSPNQAILTWNADNDVVSIESVDSLAALFLIVQGEIIPSLLVDEMTLISNWVSGTTRIWIRSDSGADLALSGPLLSIEGALEITEAQAASSEGRHVETIVQTGPGSDSFAVRVVGDEDVSWPSETQVDIVLEECVAPLGGFDFLLAFSGELLGFLSASPGEPLFVDCEWEYFSYRYESGVDSAFSDHLVRIVGLAETNNGAVHPACYEPDSLPAVIATLDFFVRDDRRVQGQTALLRFYWQDCGDNVLAGLDGTDIFISRNVYEPCDGDTISWESEFPTYHGAPDECLDPGSDPQATIARKVDFFNGSIDISCYEPDVRGDINLNGIPYEIADAVMLSDYFVQGLAAFGDHVDGSIAASDVNADGICLGIEDLVFLIRVITGDLNPSGLYPHVPSPNQALFTWYPESHSVSVSTPDSLGAVHLIVEGEITPTLLADHMDMKFGWDTGWTKILIYSFDAGEFISAGPLVLVPGATGLVEAHTATYDARPVLTAIVDDGHVARGDINVNAIPFEIGDVVMFSDYFVEGLSAFGSHAEGSIAASDVNADGFPLGLNDLVFLIRVVNGELPPTPAVDSLCPSIALKASSQGIRLTTTDSLGAAFIVVEGTVVPTVLAWGMDLKYAQVGGQTRVLIYSMEPGHPFSDGPLVCFDGEWRLVSVEISSYTGLPCVDGDITGVDIEITGELPTEYVLHPNYPNPFNPSTTIQYDLPEQARLEIVVFNVAGQRVRALVDGLVSAGTHMTVWDGKDEGGRRVASGIYFYRMTAGDVIRSRKMLLLK